VTRFYPIVLVLCVFGAAVPRATTDTLQGESLRLSLVLILDTSASVQRGRLEYPRQISPHPRNFAQLVDAAHRVITGLAPADRAALVTFGDRLTLTVPFTSDKRAIDAALASPARLHPSSPPIRSTVWDAVLAGAGLAASEPGRPLVILLSDGTDNASWHTQSSVIRAIQARGLNVDLISVPRTYATEDEDPPGSWEPDRIATATGGRAFSARDAQLGDRLRRRLAELRTGSSPNVSRR
jgi:hypothetical protein